MKSKNLREKGKLKLSRYFQELQDGDRVSVDEELSLQPRFPKRLQGRTGVVIGKRGDAYIVKIKNQAKEKEFIITPIHLKKIKITE
ncbi:MAG: 50S ribosomal protein L21e [archaeon]